MAGLVGISCFHTCYTWHISKKCVCCIYRKTSPCIQTSESIAFGVDEFQKSWFFNCIAGNPGKIRSRCVMVITGIQSICGHKMSIAASNLCGFLVHKLCKLTLRTTYMFCDCHCGIIMRRKHQRIKHISHIKLFSCSGIQLRWFLCCCPCRKVHCFIHFAVFKSKDTSHYFGRTCIGVPHIFVLCV